MTSKNIKKGFIFQILIFIVFSIFTSKTYCQLNDDKNEVTVIASYEPTISDAFKIKETPSFDDETVRNKEEETFLLINKFS